MRKDNQALTLQDIHRFWLIRQKKLALWIEPLHKKNAKLFPILIPKVPITLSTRPTAPEQTLATYLKQQILQPTFSVTGQLTNYFGQHRFVLIPYQNKNVWDTILIDVSERNQFVQVVYVSAYGTEKTIDTLLLLMKRFTDLTMDFEEKCFQLNQSFQRTTFPALSPHSRLYDRDTMEALIAQIKKAGGCDEIAQGYSALSQNAQDSGWLCLENMVNLVHATYQAYLQEGIDHNPSRYFLKPQWFDANAITRLRAHYQQSLLLRSHPSLAFSPEHVLKTLWEAFERQILNPLEQHVKAQQTLFKTQGGLDPVEALHVSHFLDSLALIRRRLVISKNQGKEASGHLHQRKVHAVLKNLPRFQGATHWCKMLLKNLVTNPMAVMPVI